MPKPKEPKKPRKKKPIPASPQVLAKKELIGRRIRDLRGGISQDAIATAGGTTRRIVGEIERAVSDYRIESLLAVIDGLELQLKTGPDALIEKVVFAHDSLESDLVEKLIAVLRRGDSTYRALVMNSIEAAATTVTVSPTARSGPTGRTQRSA